MEITINAGGNPQEKSNINERISLSCRQIYRIQTNNSTVQLLGLKGRVYVTRPEDTEDYILLPGERLNLRSRGLILIQGLPEGTFQYSS